MLAARAPTIQICVLSVIALDAISGPAAQQADDTTVGRLAPGFAGAHSHLNDMEYEVIATSLRNYLKIAAAPKESSPASTKSLAVKSGAPLRPDEAFTATPQHDPRIEPGKGFFKGAQFAGADSCKFCHAEQYEDWRKTWHSRMEAWPTATNVSGEFPVAPAPPRTVTYQTKVPKANDRNATVSISPSVEASRVGDKYFLTLIDRSDPSGKKNVKYEIAKVLGGKWDQHYEVKIEGRYYPTPLRWSVKAKDWMTREYRPEDWFADNGTLCGTPKLPPGATDPEKRPPDVPDPKEDHAAQARCMGCHTTGYEFKKDQTTKLWNETGNGELGIACESCHGPGSKHIEEANAANAKGVKLEKSTIANPLKDLTAFQQTQVCAQCHGRASNKQFPSEVNFQIGFNVGDVDITDHYSFWSYSSSANPEETKYFWHNDWAYRNRQQWQDFTKSAHYNVAGMSCLTCHTFHGKWEGPQLRVKVEEACTTCHTRNGQAGMPNKEMYSGSKMEQKSVTCVNCHMPKIGWRSGATKNTNPQWDTSSHTFLMASPSLETTVGVRNACADCHMGTDRSKGELYTLNALELEMRTIKNFTQKKLTGLNTRVAALNEAITALPSTISPNAKACVERARGNIARADQSINFVSRDGSFGIHNRFKSRNLLRLADDWLGQAESWVKKLTC